MLRNIFLVVVYLLMLALGASAPFVFTLGYVWVDIFRPQAIIYGVLQDFPFALVMAVAAIGSYILLDRRNPPRASVITILTLALGFWVTLTTLWAVAPDSAWPKWDWAFKSIMFSALIPFVIRSRTQIEAFLQVYLFALAAHFIPFGAKSMITGGGYGQLLGLINQQNDFLAEGATLSMVVIMAIPLIAFLMKHQTLLPRNGWTRLGYIGLIALALAAAVGTQERTGLVGMAVLAVSLWVYSRRKIISAALIVAVAATIFVTAPASWTERMSTISTEPTEASAATRFVVWGWTLDFVKEHPLGGGFNAYVVNEITLKNQETGVELTQRGRAFHSIYFEVLGEHGWIGLGLFLGLFASSLLALRGAAKRARGQAQLLWAFDLSRALRSSLIVGLFCGAFVGVGFQPFLYYMAALSLSLREYVRRVQQAPSPVLATKQSFAVAHP